MKLTSKSHYAVLLMLHIAMLSDKKPVKLSDISSKQSIPMPYLEQLAAKLRQANLLHSTRGANGGYTLSKLVNKITVADIVLAVGEDIDVTKCKGHNDCRDGLACLIHGLWSKLNSINLDFFSSITLAKLMEKDLSWSSGSSLNKAKLSLVLE